MTTETVELIKRVQDQLVEFKTTMDELHLLKRVASDLRNYRKMITLKRYD